MLPEGSDRFTRAGWTGEDRLDLQIATIDGSAGCGKSSVARKLADCCGGRMFSSGRVYRALTWLALEQGVEFPDRDRVLSLLEEHRLEIVASSAVFRVEVDGADPGDVLYSSRVTGEIHHVSDDPEVRKAVLTLQRGLPTDRPVFAEGRDMGTVVFPQAPVKIFLTASIEERARRRQLELRESLGEELSFEQVQRKLLRRDAFDSERDISPLKAAPDAQQIDTTSLSIEEVVSTIMERIPQDWSRGATGSTS
ncbi:MAG TPA: (d)CMP kinase [Planctomycetes bacterium]|nr:(d)CMP kinase [Planctomycetota bacterium]